MQDFTSYDYCITIDQLKEAAKIVRDISVIINGEYYTLIEEPKTKQILTHNIVRTKNHDRKCAD